MKLNNDLANSPLFDDFKDTLSFQLHRIDKAIFRNGNQLIQKAKIPLQIEQMPVLILVCAKEGMSQQDIAEILLRDKSSIQRTIVVLEKKGLVNVSRDVEDKRRNKILPTKEAFAIATKLKKIVKESEALSLQSFSAEERITIKKGLKDIADKLTQKNK